MMGLTGAPGIAVNDQSPVSAALGEEAGGECHGPLRRTAEALLLSLTMVRLFSLKEEKAEEGPERGGLIKKAGTDTRSDFVQEGPRQQPNTEVQN